MEHGFVKVAAAVPNIKVADCNYNERQMENLIAQAEGKGVDIMCFPELSMTGYSCGDIFTQQLLLDNCENSIFKLLDFTRSLKIIVIIGLPIQYNSVLLNAAIVLQGGKILGIVPKSFLPNNGGAQECRWYKSGKTFKTTTMHYCAQTVCMGTSLIFNTPQTQFGIEIGEDLDAPIPPSTALALKGAEIIFNLSANKESIENEKYIRNTTMCHSSRIISGYVISSCGFGESTQDNVYTGKGLVCENGNVIAEGERFCFDEQLTISEIDVELIRGERRRSNIFAESITEDISQNATFISCQPTNNLDKSSLTRTFTPFPFVPEGQELDKRCEEVFNIQISGLAKRIVHTNAKTLVIGISGGLDSTLALLVCAKTLDKLKRDRKDIIGITMPGFGTTDRTYTNAISLMMSLGISIKEISIKDACIQHFKDINHNIEKHDVTYENSQARERTQILMDIANQSNGLVVGTGDLSELALGWATYNGDHMSNYGVNASVPKTLIRHIVKWVAKSDIDETSKNTLLDIIDTPISPELIPADEMGNIKQKTEDLVGPYDLHDFFLYHFVRNGFRPSKIYYLAQNAFGNNQETKYSDETIKKWLSTFCRRFFNQQFKRSCMPDGPRTGSVALSPRGAWIMPSDASSAQWINECENL